MFTCKQAAACGSHELRNYEVVIRTSKFEEVQAFQMNRVVPLEPPVKLALRIAKRFPINSSRDLDWGSRSLRSDMHKSNDFGRFIC